MNKRNLSLLGVVAAAILIVALIVWLRPQPSAPPPSAPPPVAKPQPPPVAPIETPPTQPTQTVDMPETPAPEPTGPYMKVQPNETLATVNGVTITLKDLIALGGAAANSPQTMSPEMYKFLLDLAIEREVTFQAAKSQGIELTDEQQQQLNQIREQMLAADTDESDGKVIQHLNVTGSLEDRIGFDVRDAASHLLQNSMMVKIGAPSPYVTEALVQEYYQNHFHDYGALPADPAEHEAAWQKIDVEIRQKLAPTVQAEYTQHLRAYLEQLRAASHVQLANSAP